MKRICKNLLLSLLAITMLCGCGARRKKMEAASGAARAKISHMEQQIQYQQTQIDELKREIDKLEKE